MNRSVVIGLAAVAVAAVGGFLVQRTLSERGTALVEDDGAAQSIASEASATRDVPALGTGQDEAEGSPPKRAIPETVPDISLADRAGARRSLASWKGQPVVINFWATWCGPCRDEIPLLKSLRKERAADRLEIIGIAIDERQAVLEYATEIGIDYPILIGEQDGYEAAEAFGVALVLPFSVFADSRGRIVTLKVGELHADEAAFILDRIRDVDANRLPLGDARQQIADKLRDFAAERSRGAATSG